MVYLKRLEKLLIAMQQLIIFNAYYTSLMQSKINFSIQIPHDKNSKLEMHADSLSGESKFQVVLWVPLVNVFGEGELLIGVAVFHLFICAVVLLVPGVREMKSSRPPYTPKSVISS